jgi:hypothetical protein
LDITPTALKSLAAPSVPESARFDWAVRTAEGFMTVAEAFKFAESANLDIVAKTDRG